MSPTTILSAGAGHRAQAAKLLQARRNCWDSWFRLGSTAAPNAPEQMCLARTLPLRQVNKRYHAFHRRVLYRRMGTVGRMRSIEGHRAADRECFACIVTHR